jgi:hypothetical protein
MEFPPLKDFNQTFSLPLPGGAKGEEGCLSISARPLASSHGRGKSGSFDLTAAYLHRRIYPPNHIMLMLRKKVRAESKTKWGKRKR